MNVHECVLCSGTSSLCVYSKCVRSEILPGEYQCKCVCSETLVCLCTVIVCFAVSETLVCVYTVSVCFAVRH